MRRLPAERRTDEILLIAWLMTLVLGLIMIYSASSIIAESRFGSNLHFFKSQLVWTVLAIGAALLVNRIDLQRWAVYSVPALFVTLGLLCLVFLMPSRNDAQRWLMVGPLSMQPSEFFKFLVIVYLAFSLSNPKRDITDIRQLLMPYMPLIGGGLMLILLQPNLGTVMVISATVLGILYLAGARVKHIAYATLPLAGLAGFVVFVAGYKKARILSHFEAMADPLAGSYQVKQAALTFGAGGLFGRGLGEGTQKLFFLPYPHTDFIFAATGEEIGFVGLMIVLLLLIVMLFRGCQIAARQPDKFGFLLASGLTWSLFINIAMNVGMVTAILPVTGVALPFLSYGGSSLLVSCISIGALLNLSRRMER